jgi:hypothetical protein
MKSLLAVRAVFLHLILGSISAFLPLARLPTARRWAVSLAEEQQPEAIMMSSIIINKPLGIVLEEITAGDSTSGVRVAAIDPKGNAARVSIGEDPAECLLVYDQVLAVDGKQCMGASLETIMGLIKAASSPVGLTLGRGEGVVIVAWPNGIGVGARSGDSFKEVAARAMYKVKYSCEGGGCGTCEQKILLDDGTTRYVRPCVARVPKDTGSVLVEASDRIA